MSMQCLVRSQRWGWECSLVGWSPNDTQHLESQEWLLSMFQSKVESKRHTLTSLRWRPRVRASQEEERSLCHERCNSFFLSVTHPLKHSVNISQAPAMCKMLRHAKGRRTGARALRKLGREAARGTHVIKRFPKIPVQRFGGCTGRSGSRPGACSLPPLFKYPHRHWICHQVLGV